MFVLGMFAFSWTLPVVWIETLYVRDADVSSVSSVKEAGLRTVVTRAFCLLV